MIHGYLLNLEHQNGIATPSLSYRKTLNLFGRKITDIAS
jgi:hypothetical protein